jgi:hypothetical protein
MVVSRCVQGNERSSGHFIFNIKESKPPWLLFEGLAMLMCNGWHDLDCTKCPVAGKIQ